MEILKAEETLTQACELRQNKYPNNIVEQDHRLMKKLVNLGLGFKSFYMARRTIIGDETTNTIRNGQMPGVTKVDVLDRAKFIAQIFGAAMNIAIFYLLDYF